MSERAKNRLGRRGDPRMAIALKIKQLHPKMSSAAALRLGGYDFPEDAGAATRDSDGVTLRQRKNQLCRRLRTEKTKPALETGRESVEMKLACDGRDVGDGKMEAQTTVQSDTSWLPDLPAVGMQSTYQMEDSTLDSSSVGPSEDFDDISTFLVNVILRPSRSPSPARLIHKSNEEPFGDARETATQPDVHVADGDEKINGESCHLKEGEIIREDLLSPTQQEIAEAHADVRGIRRRESYLLKRLLHVSKVENHFSFLVGDTDVSTAAEFMNVDGARDTLGGRVFKPLLYDLIRQMKIRILSATAQGERAVLEAFLRLECESRKVEFGKKRLELFLRREGMDPALGAARFVRYWRKRKDLFGPNSYHLPLTADGALREDSSSLELGRFIILPEPDNHGRTIMLHTEMTPYNLQSLLRAMFCVMESAMELPSSMKGVVWLSWDKDATLWTYDHSFYEAFLGLEQTYLPIEVSAIHCCCVARYEWEIIDDTLLPCFDRRAHARLRVHFDSDDDIAEVLKEYGIDRNALPTFMGGTVDVAKTYLKWLQSIGTNLLCWPE